MPQAYRFRIIQDCEDALTSWVPQRAAVSSNLSTRARMLSQKRGRVQEPIDLTNQDRALEGESWSDHRGEYDETVPDHVDDEDHEYDLHGAEGRGREEERPLAA